MPSKKHELRKLKDREVTGLRGRLLEVRKIGSQPIFIKVLTSDTIANALKKADIPTGDTEVKIEGVKEGTTRWEELTLRDKAVKYSKIAVTTKVSGA